MSGGRTLILSITLLAVVLLTLSPWNAQKETWNSVGHFDNQVASIRFEGQKTGNLRDYWLKVNYLDQPFHQPMHIGDKKVASITELQRADCSKNRVLQSLAVVFRDESGKVLTEIDHRKEPEYQTDSKYVPVPDERGPRDIFEYVCSH